MPYVVALGQDMIEQVSAVSPTPMPPPRVTPLGPAPAAAMARFVRARGDAWAPRAAVRTRVELRGTGRLTADGPSTEAIRNRIGWCSTCVPGGVWLRSNWSGLRGLRGVEPVKVGAIVVGSLAALLLLYAAVDVGVDRLRRGRRRRR